MRIQTIIILILLFFALSSHAQIDSIQVKEEQKEIGNLLVEILPISGCILQKT